MEKSKLRRRWTKEEIEKLERLSSKYTKSVIAEKMGRSVSAINQKRTKLGIKCLFDVTDKWTFAAISEVTGASRQAIGRTWKKRGIRYTKSRNFYLVNEKDFLDFMKNNTDLWDATKCDYLLFCRYDWFLEKLEQDKKVPIDQRGCRWTECQRQQFIILKKRGFSHREIAEKLGKTKSSIDHHSIYLNNKKRGKN